MYNIIEMYFMTQIPLPWCSHAWTIFFAHQKSRVFSVASASSQFHRHAILAGKIIVLGRQVLSVVWGMHCPVCADFPAVLLPTFLHGELLLPPANWKQTSLSSAKWNPTSGYGLFLNGNLDFAENFSPRLFKAILDIVCTTGNQFSAAGRVNTRLIKTWPPKKPWEGIVKVGRHSIRASCNLLQGWH